MISLKWLPFCLFFGIEISSESDLVTDFPFLASKPPFRFYAGYLQVAADRRLYYWFAESQSKPDKDPLIWWQNGGPGASSLFGWLTEIGPWAVNESGHVTEREHSWNFAANLLAFDNPYGVGFSVSPGNRNFTTDDDQTASDNYRALLAFYRKYPNFRRNQLYLIGESYAGIYVPLLAKRIFDQEEDEDAGRMRLEKELEKINLVGIGLGNPVTDQDLMHEAYYRFAFYHEFLDEEQWSRINEVCCGRWNPATNDFCKYKDCASRMFVNFTKVYPYNVYKKCNLRTTESGTKTLSWTRDRDPGWDPAWDPTGVLGSKPCENHGDQILLNRTDVKKAIHVDPALDWSADRLDFRFQKKYTSIKETMLELIKKKVPVTLYFGDWDWNCNFVSGQLFVKRLELNVTNYSRPWYAAEGVLAGRIVQYNGLDFITVRGAGHLVPADKPDIGFRILEYILKTNKL